MGELREKGRAFQTRRDQLMLKIGLRFSRKLQPLVRFICFGVSVSIELCSCFYGVRDQVG